MFRFFVAVPLALLALANIVAADDLAKVDRTIRKEPAYREKPRYGLLVLGPKAETRVWLVIDGKTLYVDRNGNGDLTEDGERIAAKKTERSEVLEFEVGDIVEADGKTRHSGLGVSQATDVMFGTVHSVGIKDDRGSYTQAAGGGGMSFASTPRDAPVMHFKGPLTMRVISVVAGSSSVMRVLDYPYELPAGETLRDLHVEVGTPGLGKGTFAMIRVEPVPEDLHPVVEMNIPSKSDPKKTIKVEFTLKERC